MPSLLSYYRNYLNDNSGNQGGQGAPPSFVTSFSDTLQVSDPNNPDSGSLDGSKWIFATDRPANNSSPLNVAGYIISVSSKDSINCLQWQLIGAANPAVSAYAVILPIITYQGLYGLTQFAQCINIQTVNANGEGVYGVCVLANPITRSGLSAYFLGVYTTNHNWFLNRLSAGTDVILANGSTNSIVDGDILRLSADMSVVGQVTLTAKKNGSILTTFVDTTNRLTLGSPGLCAKQTTQGASAPKSEWRTFSCGAGL